LSHAQAAPLSFESVAGSSPQRLLLTSRNDAFLGIAANDWTHHALAFPLRFRSSGYAPDLRQTRWLPTFRPSCLARKTIHHAPRERGHTLHGVEARFDSVDLVGWGVGRSVYDGKLRISRICLYCQFGISDTRVTLRRRPEVRGWNQPAV